MWPPGSKIKRVAHKPGETSRYLVFLFLQIPFDPENLPVSNKMSFLEVMLILNTIEPVMRAELNVPYFEMPPLN